MMAEGLQLYLDNKAWLAGLVPIGTLDILEMLQLLVSDLQKLNSQMEIKCCCCEHPMKLQYNNFLVWSGCSQQQHSISI